MLIIFFILILFTLILLHNLPIHNDFITHSGCSRIPNKTYCERKNLIQYNASKHLNYKKIANLKKQNYI